jgi:hypothetical protein
MDSLINGRMRDAHGHGKWQQEIKKNKQAGTTNISAGAYTH